MHASRSTFRDKAKLYTSPFVKLLEGVYDVKSWLLPHIEDIHGHTAPHCFKFIKIGNEVLLYYKNWSDSSWCQDTSAIKILKVHNLTKGTYLWM